MAYVVQQQHEFKISTRASRTLLPVLLQYLLVPDSLPTVFAFLEARSLEVDMMHGYFGSQRVMVLVVSVAPVIPL